MLEQKMKLAVMGIVFHLVQIISGNPQITGGVLVSQKTVVTQSGTSNCTRCTIWQGDDCFEYKPCVFCNATVECTEPLLCQDNICALDPYFGGNARRDPLGRIIALSLLAIFLLGILTLCMKICSSTCCTDGRRCCVVQCAISIQCCCEWKTGRLRIIPNPGNNVEPASVHHRRESLCPPPPPAYGEIYPEQEGHQQRQDRPQPNAVTDQPSSTHEVTERPMGHIFSWFRNQGENEASNETTLPCNHHDQIPEFQPAYPQGRGWFRRAAASLVPGPRPLRSSAPPHRPTQSSNLWTTNQSHQAPVISSMTTSTQDSGLPLRAETALDASRWRSIAQDDSLTSEVNNTLLDFTTLEVDQESTEVSQSTQNFRNDSSSIFHQTISSSSRERRISTGIRAITSSSRASARTSGSTATLRRNTVASLPGECHPISAQSLMSRGESGGPRVMTSLSLHFEDGQDVIQRARKESFDSDTSIVISDLAERF